MSDHDRHQAAKALYHRALELPRADRSAFIREQCRDDEALCRYVETLLAGDDDSVSTFETGFLEPRALADEQHPSGLAAGTMIADRYRLVRQLGRGGMGVVWEAEQLEPVRRSVAIKLILPGMDSAGVLARFEAERQALALMDHPGVARVFDGGLTDDKRPYFVMEYVRGLPVTKYCETNALSLRDRLELFARICDAVQHAHSKAVIHRDLTPSNVLVETVDGRPMPKVIDFGIAKALTTPLTDATLQTAMGQMIGTPEYASPEQAEVSPEDVDTRSDVYSLGVMLYEMLTGVLPFPAETLRRASLREIQRIIREVEPPRPSQRLTSSGTTATSSTSSATGARSTRRALLTDLDWVVMKCLEKDRERRYLSPSEIAAELRRFLADEPILAGPPSALYRARKFTRRNALGVAVSAALIVGVIAIAISATVVSQRESRLRAAADRASEEERIAADAAEWIQSAVASTPATTIDKMLDAATRIVDVAPPNDPRLEGLVRVNLGAWMKGIGRLDDAVTHFESGERLLRESLGNNHRWVAEATMQHALGLKSVGRHDEALPLVPRGIAAARASSPDGMSDTLIRCLTDGCLLYAELATPYGFFHHTPDADCIADAQSLADELTALIDDPATPLSDDQLGWIYYSLSRLHQAQKDGERALDSLRRCAEALERGLGRKHHLSIGARNQLALDSGLGPATAPMLEEVVEDALLAMPEGHPVRAVALQNYLKSAESLLAPDEAIRLYPIAIAEAKAGFGPYSDPSLYAQTDFAIWLTAQDRPADAIVQWRRSIEIAERAPVDPWVRVMNYLPRYAQAAHRAQSPDDAREAWDVLARIMPHHPLVGGSAAYPRIYWWSALTLIEHGAPSEAIERLDDLIVRGLSPFHPDRQFRNHAEDRAFLANVLIAYAHARSGRIHQARSAWADLTELHAAKPERHLRIGRAEIDRVFARIDELTQPAAADPG